MIIIYYLNSYKYNAIIYCVFGDSCFLNIKQQRERIVMSKITISEELNPDFVLYNIVFGSNPLPLINTKNVMACMRVYQIEMDESHIQQRLTEWYSNGLLRIRDGGYVIA